MFNIKKAKPVVDFSKLAMKQIIEVIKCNKNEKLVEGLDNLKHLLHSKEIQFDGIDSGYIIDAINNLTFADLCSNCDDDDNEKPDLTEIEVKILESLRDKQFHSKVELLEDLNSTFNDDITKEFNEIIKKLSADNVVLKFDKSKEPVENVGRGSGRYSFLKMAEESKQQVINVINQ